MIPIRLEVKGLYSYRETQIIDFTRLTESGLFGIFGPVGSGKSAILEAILLALYGSTERLSDRGEKSSMVNLQSNQLFINFDFSSGRNNSSIYRARYSLKRNKKNPEKISTSEHIFYKKEGSEWVPTHQKGEDIIGMSKEHFKQTVIIPQGKFREFIDLTPGPRADMMKALFGLERFDLSTNTALLISELNKVKIRLETQLQGLEDYNANSINETKTKLIAEEKEAVEIEKNLSSTETSYRAKEQQSKQHDQWKKLKANWHSLELKRHVFNKKRKDLAQLINAHSFLKPVYEQLISAQKQVQDYKDGIEKCLLAQAGLDNEITALKETEKALKVKQGERSEREQKIRDLRKILDLKNLNIRLNGSSLKLKEVEPLLEAINTEINILEKQIQQQDKDLEKFDTLDSLDLAELKTSSQNWERWEKEQLTVKKEISETTEQKSSFEMRISGILKNLPEDFSSVEAYRDFCDAKQNSLALERDKMLEKQGLSSHIHLLEDGKPCPLCGSVDHPEPLVAGAQDLQIERINDEKEQTKSLLNQVNIWIKRSDEIKIHLSHLEETLQKKTSILNELEEKSSTIKEACLQQGISSLDALQAQISNISGQIKQKAEIETALKKKRSSLDKARTNRDKIEEEINKHILECATINAEIKSKSEEIKDTEFCASFYSKDHDEIENTIRKVENDIEKTEKDLDTTQKSLNQKVELQIQNLTQLDGYQKLHTQYSEKASKLLIDFNVLKEKHSLSDETLLLRLFEESFDREKMEKEIREFDEELMLTQSRMTDLEKEPDVVDFSEEAFIKLREDYLALKDLHQEMQTRLALRRNDIENAEKKLKEKEQLIKEQTSLEDRESRLRELDKLFKGSGFVKFVSSIYLRELCDTANKRFMKLSKNSLSIHIDEDNTFWVTDYLNGAKRRLLKTLSGGQTFQASLCLALALAEKVKALNQADQSFFFLDEGFGALDKDSLRVVFETLKSLRHENRIVGIISHVEELQEEIGVYVNIQPDSERGSQISYSF